MNQTIAPPSEIVARTTGHVERSSQRLIHLLSFVPDDKLTWTPSPASKSPLRVVAHCAVSNTFFANVIAGTMPEVMPTPEQFFTGLNEGEGKITTREGAVALLNETTAELLKAINAVGTERVDSTPANPFGPLPMSFWMEQGGGHMDYHAGQLAYLQTAWGDLDNHLD
jgi:hypothetical protein